MLPIITKIKPMSKKTTNRLKGNFTIALISLLTIAPCFAQAPEKLSYQAVVRDANNDLVTNQTVGVQISILQGSASGTSVYKETQIPLTNDNGLVSIEIGGDSATVISGDITSINWSAGTYFIKTEIDPAGGTNYTITGTSQVLSVPYAFHAKTVESITESQITDLQTYLTAETDPGYNASIASGITDTDTSNWSNKQNALVAGNGITISGDTISTGSFYLGQDTLGGIVFYIYLGSDGKQHGLIVSKTQTNTNWQNTGTTVNADRSWDGVYNMGLMSDSPAKTWAEGLGAGWYLPSIDEVSILWHSRFHVNNALNAGGHTLLATSSSYWSSTEASAANAFAFEFEKGHTAFYPKTNSWFTRAIKAF